MSQEAEQELKQFLKTTSGFFRPHTQRPDLVYANLMDFVLQHGTFYREGEANGRFLKGKPRECYFNSMVVSAQSGLPYVEGYAVARGVSMPVQHAWNLDEEGMVIESTWVEPGLAYLGIPFALGRMDDAVQHGTGCVIDDWRRDFPVLKQRWEGEDESKVWPESQDIVDLRSMTTKRERKKRL